MTNAVWQTKGNRNMLKPITMSYPVVPALDQVIYDASRMAAE